MGLSDREYYRDADQPGFRLAGPQSLVTRLVVINVLLYVVDALFFRSTHWLMLAMAVRPETLVKPWLWWQFLTAGFAHSPVEVWHIFGNMLGLWMFGRDIEYSRGPREFLRFYLLAIVLGTVAWAARLYLFEGADSRTAILLGASGGVTAVILLFVCQYPRRTILLMFVLPVPAWVLGLLLIVTNVMGTYQIAQGTSQVAYDVHLVGAAFAIAYWRLNWNLANWLPGRWPGLQRKWLKPRPRLRIHDPDPEQHYRDLDAEADAVLEKLHQQGEESLTPRERHILEAYSRRMRQKHR